MKNDRNTRFWDLVAKNYHRDEARFEAITRRALDSTIRHLKKTDVVLDVGCGTGTKTCEFAGHVKTVHAFDISSGMLEAAVQEAAGRGIRNVVFEHTTLFDERYKQASFDVILAFNVLHTMENVTEAVRQIHALLKPGGLFISLTPCLSEKMARITQFQFNVYQLLGKTGLIPLVQRFSITGLNGLIATEKFEITETGTFYQDLFSVYTAARKKNG
ncbi:class I SAM-dependent methyltransferase [bacterium]|nr:class I SAM-dependent methyltransferase [bacterium]